MTYKDKMSSSNLTVNKSYMLLSIISILWLISFKNDLVDMVHLWNTSDSYMHAYLVYPIVFYFIWSKRDEIKDLALVPAPLAILPLLIIISLWVIGRAAEVQLFSQAATVMFLPLLVWGVFGNKVAHIIWFPLVLSLYAVPFGDEFVPYLQHITAEVSVALIKLFGIPVEHDGLYIKLSSGSFEVARACSGVRYLTVSVFVCFLYCYLNFNRLKNWFLFMVLAVIVPILANSLRAFAIIMIAHFSKMEYAVGIDHIIYGWLFFGLVMLFLMYMGSILKGLNNETKISETDSAEQTVAYKKKVPTGVLYIFCIVIFSGINFFTYKLSEFNNNTHQVAISSEINKYFVELPASLVTTPQFMKPNSVYIGRSKVDPELDIYIARYSDYSGDRELLGWSNKIYNQSKWSLVSAEDLTIDLKSGPLGTKILNLVSLKGEKKRILYWYELKKGAYVDEVVIKINQAMNKLTGNSDQGAFISFIIHNKKLTNLDLKNSVKTYYELIRKSLNIE